MPSNTYALSMLIGPIVGEDYPNEPSNFMKAIIFPLALDTTVPSL